MEVRSPNGEGSGEKEAAVEVAVRREVADDGDAAAELEEEKESLLL